MRSPLTRLGVVLWWTALASLAWAQGPGDPLQGTFGDGRLTLVLQATAQGQYAGRLVIDGQTYPAVASGSPSRVDGRFDAPGGSFGFTASLAGDVVTLVTGSTTYRLARVSAAAAPAAGALTPGLIVSYEFAVASHPGNTGNPDARGSGATGVNQYRVVHHDERLCVVTSTDYMRYELGGPLVPSPNTGRTIVSRDGTCGELWWPVDRLRAYTAPPDGSQRVERGPFQLPQGGGTVEALYVRQELADTRFARTWDLATGLLVAYSDGTGPTPAPAAVPTSSSHLMFLGARLSSRPWDPRQPLPERIAALSELRYRATVTSGFSSGITAPMTQSNEMVLQVVERHPAFLLLRPQGAGPDAFALLSSHGELFLPPTAAATLQTGQRLDDDPVIGSSVRVARADAQGVVIETQAATFQVQSTYDAGSGLLTSERVTYTDGVTTTTIEIVLLEAR